MDSVERDNDAKVCKGPSVLAIWRLGDVMNHAEASGSVLDEEIVACLSGIERPSAVAVRGGPGTGKSLLAAHLLDIHLRTHAVAGACLRVSPAGGVRQFLNQAMGVGINLYSHLRTQALFLLEVEPSPRSICAALLSLPATVDVVMFDAIQSFGSMTSATLTEALAALVKARHQSALLVTDHALDTSLSSLDATFDLVRTGRDVERAQADALLYVTCNSLKLTRNFNVGATRLHVWGG